MRLLFPCGCVSWCRLLCGSQIYRARDKKAEYEPAEQDVNAFRRYGQGFAERRVDRGYVGFGYGKLQCYFLALVKEVYVDLIPLSCAGAQSRLPTSLLRSRGNA